MKRINKIFGTELAKNTIVYTISSFFNKGMTFFLIPLLMSEMTVEEYGTLSMVNATIVILIPFVGMSIDGAFGRVLADENDSLNKRYIFNCFIILFFATFIVSIICAMARGLFDEYLSIPNSLLPFVVAASVLEVFIATASVTIQYQNRKKAYILFQNGETLLNFVLTILFMVVLGLSLKGRVYSILCSKFVFAIGAVFLIYKYIGIDKTFDRKLMRDELVNFGIPMIPTSLKNTILNYLDRIFITNMKTITDTAHYTLGNQLALPILFLAQAFNLAYSPWLYKKLSCGNERKKEKIVKMTYVYFIAILVISFIWAVIVSNILSAFVTDDYHVASDYIIWLSLGYAFTGMYMMVVNYIYYAKKIMLYNAVTITVIISNLILNYILINQNGAIGAAQATLAVNMISFILTWFLAARVYKMPWILKVR